jgi:hypothetical protein
VSEILPIGATNGHCGANRVLGKPTLSTNYIIYRACCKIKSVPVQKSLRISRLGQQSMKPSTGLSAIVIIHEADLAHNGLIPAMVWAPA